MNFRGESVFDTLYLNQVFLSVFISSYSILHISNLTQFIAILHLDFSQRLIKRYVYFYLLILNVKRFFIYFLVLIFIYFFK